MPQPETYNFEMDIQVHDAQALFGAALIRMGREQPEASVIDRVGQLCNMDGSLDLRACLWTLLDPGSLPGSLPGCSILGSNTSHLDF